MVEAVAKRRGPYEGRVSVSTRSTHRRVKFGLCQTQRAQLSG